MKTIWLMIQMIFTGIGAYLGYFLGGFDGLLYALILFVVVDYITGLIRGIIEKKLSSEIGFKGILRKVIIFMLVAVAHMLDAEIIGKGDALRTAVIFFYISNEGISILENAANIGVPVPKKLRDVLAQLKDDKRMK